MTMTNAGLSAPPAPEARMRGGLSRFTLTALMAFLTLVDLFAAQAILPALAARYGVSASAMGLAANASTLGMAGAALGVALLSRFIDQRTGIIASLALLAVPTLLLASAPGLGAFAALRVAQGLCMATAFTLTLAYLGEHTHGADMRSAFAAYVTGNVASNLIGRLVSAAITDHIGLGANFYLFAALNLTGAALAFATLQRTALPAREPMDRASLLAPLKAHLRNPPLIAACAIGFCILFAFIGTFTYVNFVLSRPPLSLGMMSLGFVYFVFAPSILTTPIAGSAAERLGLRPALWGGLALAAIGLPLMTLPSLPAVLAGMVCVGVGTFFAQAIATGFVSRAAKGNRGAASGLYLAFYFSGGMAGSAVIGQLYDRLGWNAAVIGVGVSLAIAAALTRRLVTETA